MKSTRLVLAALFAVTTALPAQQAPQSVDFRSSTTKFFFGGGINGSAINVENSDDTDSGGGLTFALGYGFTPSFALFIELAGAQIESNNAGDYSLAHFDLGGRYHFANPNRRWVPFLEAALTGRAAAQNDVSFCDINNTCSTGDLKMSGAGFTFGGGVMWYAKPKLALTAGLKWTVGEFSDVSFENLTISGLDVDATTTRFTLGVLWFPRR